MNVPTRHVGPESSGLSAFREALRALYAELDAAIGRLAPVCELSGRCCRFKDYDHTLFLTAAEAAFLRAEAGPPVRALDAGETCPWQDARGRCTAREGRPIGCRVYFCDPRYQGHAPELSETFLARLRALVETHGLPWDYAPLHVHLNRAVQAGRFPVGDPVPLESHARSTLERPEADSRLPILT